MIVLETLLQDARYGIRMLYRSAAFTAVTVFALALGIGVNTAVFTAYKAMIARPLGARDSGEMVNVAVMRDSGAADFSFSYPDYEGYRDSIHSFGGLIAFSPERAKLSNTEFASVFAVSENYFKVLGIAALRGRTFDSMSRSELAASPSVLVSENYWRRQFAGDSALLGKMVRLNDATVTVAGITPHDFGGTGVVVPDFWLPLSLEPLLHADENWLRERTLCRWSCLSSGRCGARYARR